MKTITIDFSGKNIEFPNGKILGCEGIHNVITLKAILPENLICKEIKTYNMLFRNGEGEFVLSDELLLDENSVSCVLWEQLMCGNELSVQVQGVGFENGEVTEIDKTPVAELEIERSVDGERVKTDSDSHAVSAQLTLIREKLAMIEILGSINGVCLSKSEINSRGELILTYSNGKTYNLGSVKGENGRDGSDGKDGADGEHGADGYTPIKGVDYWTEADKEEINAGNIALISTELAKRGQLKPEFANDISECVDTTKLYVLPDGYIYAYMYTEKIESGYTNLADPTDPDWKDDYRFSNSSEVSDAQSIGKTTVSNLIECGNGDVVRIKGIIFNSDNRIQLHFNNGTGRSYFNVPYTAGGVALWSYNKIGDETKGEEVIYEFTMLSDKTNYTIQGLRFAMPIPENASDVIVTVNQPITEPTITREYDWINTGRAFVPADYESRIIAAENSTMDNANKISNLEQGIRNVQAEFGVDVMNLNGRVTQLENNEVGIPDYWDEHLSQKITDINELHEQYGKDCFSFVVMTDMHYQSNIGRKAPLLAKKIMDECGIRYALCLGDTQTRGCWNTVEELRAENKDILQMLEPIKDRLLRTQGNHDGNYGRLADGTTYVYRIAPQELHNHIYRKVGLVGDAHFDESGTGYWIDDTVNKVRYIILNCHNTAYELNSDDTQKYSNMHIFRFGQSQYDMVIDALNTIPSSSWSIVLAGHVALGVNAGHSHWGSNGVESNADCTLMDNLLSAYKQGKASFEGTFSESGKYDYVSIATNFIDPQNRGTIVGFFGGHTHLDLNTKYSGSVINRITTRCDAKEENDTALKAERVAGTTTEQSFDVFTVDTKNKKIYATKIGAGSNPDQKIAREIGY